MFRLLNLYIQHYMLNVMDDLLVEFADTCKGMYGSTYYIKCVRGFRCMFSGVMYDPAGAITLTGTPR